MKRLVARELTLSFVPDAEQRLWRTVTRRKYQLTRDRVRLQNQLESFLEEAHIKLSSLVSDLLGLSALFNKYDNVLFAVFGPSCYARFGRALICHEKARTRSSLPNKSERSWNGAPINIRYHILL